MGRMTLFLSFTALVLLLMNAFLWLLNLPWSKFATLALMLLKNYTVGVAKFSRNSSTSRRLFIGLSTRHHVGFYCLGWVENLFSQDY